MRMNSCIRLAMLLLALSCLAGSRLVHADIAVIVHPQNPLVSLTEEDTRRIFLGRMRLFPGTQQSVAAVDLPEENPLFTLFYKQLTALSPAKLKRLRASYLFSGKGRLPVVRPSEQEVIGHVAKTPDAIGYVDSTMLSDGVKVVFQLGVKQ